MAALPTAIQIKIANRPTSLEQVKPEFLEWYNRCISYTFSPDRDPIELTDEAIDINELLTHFDLELPPWCSRILEDLYSLYEEFFGPDNVDDD